MSREYPVAGFPTPIVVNETGNRQYALPGVVVNETAGGLFRVAPLNGLGTGGAFFSDALGSP